MAEPDNTRWQRARSSPAFTALMRLKARCVAPLLVLSLGWIVVVALLAGYAKDFMGRKIGGSSFTMGYLLLLSIYLVCWTVAVIYVRQANRRFDAQAQAAIEELKR